MIEEDEGLIESEESTDIDVTVLKIAEQIGAGSYGMVYRGSYFNSQVAIKKIRPGEHNRDLQKYLKREIAVLKNIQHPNIVQFIGVYYEQNESSLPSIMSNQTWIVTEYVPGGNLHEKIKDSAKQFPLSLRFKLSLDIALAMAYLHSRNILFRDLKSKNILIDDTSSPIRGKVCDFGFARIVKNKSRHLSICGTDDFMAPEVILGMDYDESADIFSFGVVMLEMATRKKISKYIERGPHNAFEISEDLARELIPESIPGLYTELIIDCIKYTPSERPVFSHIIHVLKQLVSLFPIPLSIENPLSPQSSPIIPRKNSRAVAMNLPPLEGLLRKSIELKINDGLTSSGSSISSNVSSAGGGSGIGSGSSGGSSRENNHENNCNNSQQNEHCNNNNSNNNNEENDNQVTIGGDDELDLDDEEKESKVKYLKERMLLVLADLNKYMDVQCQELLSISQEDQIADKYDECRKVIELRKVLCEVVGDDVPPTTPKKSTPPTTRVGIFLKSMDKSLQEIFVSIELLKIRIEKEKQLLESIYLARAVSKLKRIYESKLVIE